MRGTLDVLSNVLIVTSDHPSVGRPVQLKNGLPWLVPAVLCVQKRAEGRAVESQSDCSLRKCIRRRDRHMSTHCRTARGAAREGSDDGQAGMLGGCACLSLRARVNVGCFDINDFGNARMRGPGVSCLAERAELVGAKRHVSRVRNCR